MAETLKLRIVDFNCNLLDKPVLVQENNKFLKEIHEEISRENQ